MKPRQGRLLASLIVVLCVALTAPTALSQLAKPRTLDELKAEVQLRADRKAYPVAALDAAEVREALTGLKSLDRDEWAAAWSAIGDRHAAAARAAETGDRARAIEQYRTAVEYYMFARFPLENSAGKEQAYRQALDAFAAYARLLDPPLEIVRIPFEGKEIVGYLRLPKNVRPAPVVVTIGGLDGRKEDAAVRNDAYLAHGVAYFAFDMPGTGQSPFRVVTPDAERQFSRVLDYIATRPDLDAKRVVVYGGSWGGYWSARLAYTERARIRGAVVQGGPVHEYFQPAWQRKALGTREYLFELFEARAAIYGVSSLDDFLSYGPRMSLLTSGIINQPSAPMLLIGGLKDSQVPADDLMLLLRAGSPKEVWFNPEGGHMGRTVEMSDKRIFETVTLPWVVRKLNGDTTGATLVSTAPR
ncbi:MAG TPA: alpha/beta fold hydrolase [Casimicrobiaceae bacterium]|nr:alpha/beta fold hydrolase [Casimicrobiaceae bacterium]